MKFSVVTISFNQAAFLEKTILSVVSQTGVELEYIIVDPGSTDGSRDIIERHKGRFAHILLDKDNGPADGLNRGFARATGDVYCYLNSDDTFEPGALAAAAKFLGEHPEFDVICGHAWVTDKDDKRLRRAWSEPYTRVMVAYGASVQIQPSTFIRRDAYLKSGGFNVENRSSWDGELLTMLFLSGARIGIADTFFSSYRLHAVSITNSGRLLAAARKANRDRFLRLMGRPMNAIDTHLGKWIRAAKRLRDWRGSWERLSRGPIFNRGVE